MNIVTDYTKKLLDRSAYISDDRYKRAFDLNRVRLATQKVIGQSSRYAYYYNEAMYKKLLAMIPPKYNVSGMASKLLEVSSKGSTDDDEQLRIAEETYGKETIEAIIDVVTGDDDLGDYDEDEEDIKREAEEQADSDSDRGEIRIPPFDIPGKTNPITETTKDTGGKTVEETVTTITETGTSDGTNPVETPTVLCDCCVFDEVYVDPDDGGLCPHDAANCNCCVSDTCASNEYYCTGDTTISCNAPDEVCNDDNVKCDFCGGDCDCDCDDCDCGWDCDDCDNYVDCISCECDCDWDDCCINDCISGDCDCDNCDNFGDCIDSCGEDE